MSDIEYSERGPGSKRVYASGAAKRKHRLKIESEKAKLPKVTSFFQQQRQHAPEDMTDDSTSISQSDVCKNTERVSITERRFIFVALFCSH
jgi:hypothetical protein